MKMYSLAFRSFYIYRILISNVKKNFGCGDLPWLGSYYKHPLGYRSAVDICSSPAVLYSQSYRLKPLSICNRNILRLSFKRITQKFLGIPHFSWLSVFVIAFLSFFLVLLSPFVESQAMAISAVSQVTSEHSVTSGVTLFSVENFLLISSLILFIVGYIMSLQPIFVHPVGKTRVCDSASDSVSNCLGMSSFLLTGALSLQLTPPAWGPTGLEGMLYLALCAVLNMMENSLIRYLTGRKGKSIRPLYCALCREKLQKLDSTDNVLNEIEKTAIRIQSSVFEAWQCIRCYPGTNRDSIHLRVYRLHYGLFKACPDCREVTMKSISSEVLQEATTSSEGRELVSYACCYCSRIDSRIEVIPRQTADDCAD